MNLGSSNRQIYDQCNFEKRVYESTSPLMYNMMFNKYEHCNKCRSPNNKKFHTRGDATIVDVESELLNITRPLSKCDKYQYSPHCTKSKYCTSTFDKSVPIIFVPEVCPIVNNNILRATHPGYTLEKQNICK